MGRKLLDISLRDEFLNLTPKTKGTKAKINKWDYITLKSFCTAKETINRMKRQDTKWEKIFTNLISDKGLIPKVYKEHIQLNRKNPDNLIKNGQKL